VFLSYASQDREAVERIAMWLEDEARLTPFFDRWRMVVGGDSQGDLEVAISTSRCCAVFLGTTGLGPWQTEELQAAIQLAVNERRLRVIPVLLPGSSASSDLPVFLRNRTWCVLGSDADDYAHGLEGLRRGILNEPPGRGPNPAMPRWLTVVVGGGVLQEPTGIAIAGQDLFVADREANRIIKIGPSGVLTEASGLDRPHHLVVNNEQVIVCDTHANRLAAFTLQLEPKWERRRASRRALCRPHGLCLTPQNGLLVLNTDKHRLDWVSTPRERQQAAAANGDGGWATPCGIAWSPEGIFVADTFNHRIVVLDDGLQQLHEFGHRGYGDGEFANPVGVACWHEYVVIADEHNQRMQIWEAVRRNGSWTSKLLTADACGSHLGSPFGVTFNRFGKLYVTDRKRGRVLCIDFQACLEDLT
jgi:hypothetical protein